MASGHPGDPDAAERGGRSNRSNARRLGRFSGWDNVYRFVWLVIALIFAIVLVMAFVPRCRRLTELKKRRADLQEQIRLQEIVTQEMREKQNEFTKDPGYVERVAKEAGMIRPDEVVFKASNSQARVADRSR